MCESYFNIAQFNLDDHSLTFVLKVTLFEISPIIIIELYDLPEVDAPLYPYKGTRPPTKIAMHNLFVGAIFVGPQGPKWSLEINRVPFHVMLPQFRLLAKIVLTNIWPISCVLNFSWNVPILRMP